MARVKKQKREPACVQMSNYFSDLIPSAWRPEFETRRDLDYSIENKPYIESLAELGVEQKVETGPETGEGESIVRIFMRNPTRSDLCQPLADQVEEFCFGAKLQDLREEREEFNSPVAWLDEGSFEGGVWRSRTYRGPLSARDLYKALKKLVRHPDLESTPLRKCRATPDPGQQLPDENGQDEPNAERRLIFITDLDGRSIYALIGTASKYQAFALRSAIYTHLAFETFIGVKSPPKGLLMFQMEFHLPYLLWRSSERQDPRQNAEKQPLRQCRDVSFLDWKSRSSTHFLFDAQISCVVAGSDEWRWVAYCFVDTYFDAEAMDNVQSYHDASLGDEGMRADPFTCGQNNAENPIQNPREYFLRVLQIRLEHIHSEWQQLVAKVKKSIREYEQTHIYTLPRLGEHSSSKEAEKQAEKIRRSSEWVGKAMRLSGELSNVLLHTVNAGETLFSSYAINFHDLFESLHGQRLLAAIRRTFNELELLKMTVDLMEKDCDKFARELEVNEAVKLGGRQNQLAQEIQGLSVIMMLYFSPIALTAGIFSMREDVLPFIPATFGSFVCLILTFGVLGILFYLFQLYGFWCWRKIIASAKQIDWDKKAKGACFNMLRQAKHPFRAQRVSTPQQDVENEPRAPSLSRID